MTSEPPQTAYVWVWLPGHSEPVVAGRVDDVGPFLQFTYGRSYLSRGEAVPLYLPELPLQAGPQQPPVGFDAHGCIRDAAPDAWGQRVILHRLLGRGGDRDTSDVGLLTYLLASGPDRIGALDVQESPELYTPRPTGAPLEQLLEAADRVQAGQELTEELGQALLAGSSVGGARPKALLNDGGRALIAKFSAPGDTFPWIAAEAVAMQLAARTGLNVARTRLTRSMGRDVLLVERFDRVHGTGQRRMVVSALTVLGLHEMLVRHGSYAELADTIRHRFTAPTQTLRELFARIVCNVLVGNTDDHPRNHAAFWDGRHLTLTPAYDIAPQPRSGGEAAQAMAIGHTTPGSDIPTTAPRLSKLSVCLQAADTYHLDPHEAREIIDRLVTVVHEAPNTGALLPSSGSATSHIAPPDPTVPGEEPHPRLRSAWSAWDAFCDYHSLDPERPADHHLVAFIDARAAAGVGYSNLNAILIAVRVATEHTRTHRKHDCQ